MVFTTGKHGRTSSHLSCLPPASLPSCHFSIMCFPPLSTIYFFPLPLSSLSYSISLFLKRVASVLSRSISIFIRMACPLHYLESFLHFPLLLVFPSFSSALPLKPLHLPIIHLHSGTPRHLQHIFDYVRVTPIDNRVCDATNSYSSQSLQHGHVETIKHRQTLHINRFCE